MDKDEELRGPWKQVTLMPSLRACVRDARSLDLEKMKWIGIWKGVYV